MRLLIDRETLEAEYLGCHPCVNTSSSLKIKMSDILEKFLPGRDMLTRRWTCRGNKRGKIRSGPEVPSPDFLTDFCLLILYKSVRLPSN